MMINPKRSLKRSCLRVCVETPTGISMEVDGCKAFRDHEEWLWKLYSLRQELLAMTWRRFRQPLHVIASQRVGANGSRECAPDDRLRAARCREAIQSGKQDWIAASQELLAMTG
jgi:hypothetical protein